MPAHRFKPGDPKPPGSGKKKGSHNKKSLEFQEILAQHNFSPAEAYLTLFKRQMEILNYRRKRKNIGGMQSILKDGAITLNNICQYVYPKKKAVEHTGEVGIKTFVDFMKDALESDGLDEDDEDDDKDDQ
jgi:hypothetical protein